MRASFQSGRPAVRPRAAKQLMLRCIGGSRHPEAPTAGLWRPPGSGLGARRLSCARRPSRPIHSLTSGFHPVQQRRDWLQRWRSSRHGDRRLSDRHRHRRRGAALAWRAAAGEGYGRGSEDNEVHFQSCPQGRIGAHDARVNSGLDLSGLSRVLRNLAAVVKLDLEATEKMLEEPLAELELRPDEGYTARLRLHVVALVQLALPLRA